MSRNFVIEGIEYPGRVALFRMGEVRLYECTDEVLLKIYQEGLCGYVKLTPEGFKKYFPEKAPITVKETNIGQVNDVIGTGPVKKTTQKRKPVNE